MEEMLAIKLKPRNGGDIIIDKDDVESIYFGDVVECILFKNNELTRCKKAKQAVIHLKKSADKYGGGKISVFERLCSERNLYIVELLHDEIIEEILLPYKRINGIETNILEKHEFDNGLKIKFSEKFGTER
ncbi:hypothetical protein SELR_14370 [Selenomonas ruminantium subsp. lactilytica TAM6421]|uniref:Uncharacterized protein n=2 Tax=Selenomonas ruminantium TaxID=971 RepID=I0GQV8_SELRL|nr:hypothetical protein SELR_14370 [Selenomonas ruminantium subsp. lactilytica TAM6421]